MDEGSKGETGKVDARQWVIGHLPELLLGLAVTVAGVILVNLTTNITFLADEWELLMRRTGWAPDRFLEPFHEHMIMAPTLIYKILIGVFGLGSARPEQLLAIATFLLVGVLVFVYVRRRTGDWVALIIAALILFLGAAFEDLVWAFQIGFFGSLAAGIGALIALDRDDHKGDLIAAGLLVVAMSFSSIGIPFVAGAVAEWAINPRDRRKRVIMPAIPIAFYVIWWLIWGHTADNSFAFSNIPDVPRWTFDSAGAGFTSLAGLATGDGSEPDQPHLIWGKLMLIAVLLFAGWRIYRDKGISKGLAVTFLIAFSFFALQALNQSGERFPTSSRYQLPSAIFLVLFISELLRGLKIPGPAVAAAGALSLVAILGGQSLMSDQVNARWEPASSYSRAIMSGADLADDAGDPDYNIGLFQEPITLGTYLEQTRAHGSPGYEESALAELDPALRARVDQTLIEAEGIILVGSAEQPDDPNCETTRPGGAAVEVVPGAQPISVKNSGAGNLSVLLARYSDPPGLEIGSILPRSSAIVSLPSDASSRPWLVSVDGSSRARICQAS